MVNYEIITDIYWAIEFHAKNNSQKYFLEKIIKKYLNFYFKNVFLWLITYNYEINNNIKLKKL